MKGGCRERVGTHRGQAHRGADGQGSPCGMACHGRMSIFILKALSQQRVLRKELYWLNLYFEKLDPKRKPAFDIRIWLGTLISACSRFMSHLYHALAHPFTEKNLLLECFLVLLWKYKDDLLELGLLYICKYSLHCCKCGLFLLECV